MYRLVKNEITNEIKSVHIINGNVIKSIPFDPANTDYQTFKSAVLNQEPGGAVVEDGESFSLNTNPNDSILEDADGNVMTIDEAKAYVRTLP
jgi:hypothetical protein